MTEKSSDKLMSEYSRLAKKQNNEEILRGNSFSTYGIFSEKLTFLTPENFAYVLNEWSLTLEHISVFGIITKTFYEVVFSIFSF